MAALLVRVWRTGRAWRGGIPLPAGPHLSSHVDPVPADQLHLPSL